MHDFEFDSHLHNFRMVLITKGVLYEKYSKIFKNSSHV